MLEKVELGWSAWAWGLWWNGGGVVELEIVCWVHRWGWYLGGGAGVELSRWCSWGVLKRVVELGWKGLGWGGVVGGVGWWVGWDDGWGGVVGGVRFGAFQPGRPSRFETSWERRWCELCLGKQSNRSDVRFKSRASIWIRIGEAFSFFFDNQTPTTGVPCFPCLLSAPLCRLVKVDFGFHANLCQSKRSPKWIFSPLGGPMLSNFYFSD